MLLPITLSLALALQAAPEAAAATAPAKAAVADVSDIPNGAPTDDYGFTAWCRGALSGHMELYAAVKPELQKVEAEKAAKEDARYTTDAQREAAVKRRTKEALDDTKLDEEQLAAGRTYLKLYTDAIVAAEAASAANLRLKGEEAQDAGYRIWAAARGAEPRTKMWSWVMWELPARCETAARRLLDRSSLLAGALKPQALPEPTIQAKADFPAAADTPKQDDAPAADAKSGAATPEAGALKLRGSEAPSAEDEKLSGAADAKSVAAPKSADPAPAADAPAAQAVPAGQDGPVARRSSTAPPSDAPDASPSAAKP